MSKAYEQSLTEFSCSSGNQPAKPKKTNAPAHLLLNNKFVNFLMPDTKGRLACRAKPRNRTSQHTSAREIRCSFWNKQTNQITTRIITKIVTGSLHQHHHEGVSMHIHKLEINKSSCIETGCWELFRRVTDYVRRRILIRILSEWIGGKTDWVAVESTAELVRQCVVTTRSTCGRHAVSIAVWADLSRFSLP